MKFKGRQFFQGEIMSSSIKCAPNGPFIVEGECPLIKSNGEEFSTGGKMALCRCGASNMRPMCDGSHIGIDFKDTNESDQSKNKKFVYKGEKITVYYNKELCSHAAKCVAGSPDVFDPGKTPWIQPDNADDFEKLKQTLVQCPSGALSFKVEGEEETSDFGLSAEKITIAKDGPYNVEGSIELKDTDFAEGASHEHFALCRCGKSRNKPFCDGYHREIGFKSE